MSSSFEEFSKSRLTTASESEKPGLRERFQELYDTLGNMRTSETDPAKKDSLSKAMALVIVIAAAIGVALVMW